MEKAVFLDRDGTINEEMGYINHISRFKIFPFTSEAIKIFTSCGYKVFVITNQAGLARGYFNEDVLNEVNERLLDYLNKNQAHIEKIYFCPHLKDAVVEKYKKDCECRKPKPGMILKAKKEYAIDLSQSFMIGDRYKDIEFGKKQGLKTIMVLTGYGMGEFTHQKQFWKIQPDFICKNLLEAAKVIRQQTTRAE